MKRFNKLMASSVVAMLVGAPVFAGGLQPVTAEPVVETAAPPVATYGGDWTGGYAGLSLGNLNVNVLGGGPENDDIAYGAHIGYDYDFGQFVLGGELEYEGTDVNLGGVSVDSVARLKLRGGYDMGRTLLYVTAGVAEADSSIGSDTGGFGGIGLAYKVTDQFYVGGEILGHKFDNFAGTGSDLEATSVSIRGGVRF